MLNSLITYPTEDATKQPVNSCVFSALDYCSSLFRGRYNFIHPTQKGHNPDARIIPSATTPSRLQTSLTATLPASCSFELLVWRCYNPTARSAPLTFLYRCPLLPWPMPVRQTHAGSNYFNASTAKPDMPFALSRFNPHTGTISTTTSGHSATLSSFRNTVLGMYCANVTLLTSPQGQIAQ